MGFFKSTFCEVLIPTDAISVTTLLRDSRIEVRGKLEWMFSQLKR